MAAPVETRPRWRAIALGVFVALAGYVLLHFFWMVRSILLLLFLGVIFGITLAEPANALTRWKIPRGVTAFVLVTGLLALLVVLGWLIAPQISTQFRELQSALPDALDRVEHALESRSIAGLTFSKRKASQALREFFASDGVMKMVFPVVMSSIVAAASAAMLIFIAIYVAAENRLYYRGLVRLVPPSHRARAAALLDELGGVLRRWLVARLIAMVVIGAVTGVSLWGIGIPAATALGLITALLEFIPFFGPIASAIPAVAMGLVISPMKAVWVIVIFIVVQHLESDVVSPLIMRSRIAVPPLLTIVAVATLGIVFGLPGMLISEPLTASLIVITRAVYVEPMETSAGVPLDAAEAL